MLETGTHNIRVQNRLLQRKRVELMVSDMMKQKKKLIIIRLIFSILKEKKKSMKAS